jgi:hypothetical protein
MVDDVSSSEVIEVLAAALGASRKASDAISLPTVLLPGQWFGDATGTSRVDAVEYWFHQHGFSAERSHRGGWGYAHLFRELESWRPWDVEAIRRTYEDETLQRRAFIAERFPQFVVPQSVEAHSDESFQQKLALIGAMTKEQFEGCYEAIFDSWEEEEGRVVADWGPPTAGAPDLFVWHSRPELASWFFCEVKAYGDYLGKEQHAWLGQWWSAIGGRFLLLLLDSSS